MFKHSDSQSEKRKKVLLSIILIDLAAKLSSSSQSDEDHKKFPGTTVLPVPSFALANYGPTSSSSTRYLQLGGWNFFSYNTRTDLPQYTKSGRSWVLHHWPCLTQSMVQCTGSVLHMACGKLQGTDQAPFACTEPSYQVWPGLRKSLRLPPDSFCMQILSLSTPILGTPHKFPCAAQNVLRASPRRSPSPNSSSHPLGIP